VARFPGKEEGDYQFGDVSKEINRWVKDRISDYLEKEYNQRKAWMEDFLGKEATEQY
jgi:DNA-binding cell septation regulator SpoVG